MKLILGSQFILILFFINSIYGQNNIWKYPNAKNIKGDVVILYEVTYDRELTKEEQKTRSLLDAISVTYNKNKMVVKYFYKNIPTHNSYYLYDYNKKKHYDCSGNSRGKLAISYDLNNLKSLIERKVNLVNEKKEIIGFLCDKAIVDRRGGTKELFFTKEIGLRYSDYFDVEGFLLQYPGYDKRLGNYTVTAKKIQHAQMPKSFFSLEGFEIKTSDEMIAITKKKAEEKRLKSLEWIGKKSKKIAAKDLQGDKISSKKMEGEVTVLNFWFTTCAPCKAEIPQLNKLKQRYKDKKVNFIAIALDSESRLRKFLNKQKFNYSIVPDGRWISDKFGVTSFPTNMIVDKEGIVQYYSTGYLKNISEKMSEKINQLLN